MLFVFNLYYTNRIIFVTNIQIYKYCSICILQISLSMVSHKYFNTTPTTKVSTPSPKVLTIKSNKVLQ